MRTAAADSCMLVSEKRKIVVLMRQGKGGGKKERKKEIGQTQWPLHVSYTLQGTTKEIVLTLWHGGFDTCQTSLFFSCCTTRVSPSAVCLMLEFRQREAIESDRSRKSP